MKVDSKEELGGYSYKFTATLHGYIVCRTCEKIYGGSDNFLMQDHSGHDYGIVESSKFFAEDKPESI